MSRRKGVSIIALSNRLEVLVLGAALHGTAAW